MKEENGMSEVELIKEEEKIHEELEEIKRKIENSSKEMKENFEQVLNEIKLLKILSNEMKKNKSSKESSEELLKKIKLTKAMIKDTINKIVKEQREIIFVLLDQI
ncbi:MAG: hypothetical protein AAB732_00715 [Patescibacteria group bacterium]